MTSEPALKRLKTAAGKAAARAAAAKSQVRLAKAQLKEARKAFKAAKKAAKQARRQADAAGSSLPKTVRTPKVAQPKPAVKKTAPPRASKARAPKVPPMRSAAEIAKTVIERLHSPPPVLPTPIIPPDAKPISNGSTPETPVNY